MANRPNIVVNWRQVWTDAQAFTVASKASLYDLQTVQTLISEAISEGHPLHWLTEKVKALKACRRPSLEGRV